MNKKKDFILLNQQYEKMIVLNEVINYLLTGYMLISNTQVY